MDSQTRTDVDAKRRKKMRKIETRIREETINREINLKFYLFSNSALSSVEASLLQHGKSVQQHRFSSIFFLIIYLILLFYTL